MDTSKIAINISRLAAVQLMYEKDLLNMTADKATENFQNYIKQEELYSNMNSKHFKKLVSHFADDIDFNDIYKKHISNISAMQQSKIIESIIKVAIIETLNSKTAIPVIINEYIEIARDFSSLNETKMLNAMLDRILKNIDRVQND